MMHVPRQVVIETTSKCNLKCKLCPTVCDSNFKSGHMNFETFKMIIDKIDFKTDVVPWLNGETFLNPEYHLMLRYLNEKKIPHYTTTNGTIWREDVLYEMMREGSTAYQLIISLDGLWGSGNVAKARPGSDEAAIHRHINRILRMKGDMDSPLDIAVKICERGQDWGEIEKFAQYWLEDEGIDYVVIGKALKGTNDVSMRTEPCQYSDCNFMVIRWDGTLINCAYNPKIINDLMLSYGKVTEDSNLLELFNNESISEFRNNQRIGRYPEPCNLCTFAYTGHGMRGKISFNDNPENEYFFQQDFYNTFISKVQKWKPVEYYK
jgi:MoaA/NifB/PqqE/SkfB family radical SAM enzyme